MRVFQSLETPSMAPMWRKMREIRALVTKQPQQRFSASNWRKSSAHDAAKRFSSATSYLSAVRVKSHRRSSVAMATFESELEQATDIHEFELLDVLGRGTFGTVHLARHLDTGATVAVKVLARHLVHELKQEKNIMREQSVHLGLLHPFVSKLYATFQDKDALYFVLEFCPGGEIYSLVYTHDDGHLEEDDSDTEEERKSERNEVEQEPEASDSVTTDSESDDEQSRQRRGASIALSRNSLTLENFLAKQKLRSSYGGLHERYVAFYGADDYEPRHSNVCVLIRKLLEKDPALRFASFAEVRKSMFFRSFFPSTLGWQQLESRQVVAPFVPRLDGPFDTSLFVRVQDDEEQSYGSDADSDFGY
ncbi:Serine/threonine-protein kinase Sgk1 [Phytophthora ramorum]|uniref:Serine/threonine-protein kinase Sgk1 n=1 Tax=Phytophthora ramorum TaxID=164328 RepID=UPI0030B298ED|nr:Serine/threonine-protein kinase Sgk1 [Phytophthora ramorum]